MSITNRIISIIAFLVAFASLSSCAMPMKIVGDIPAPEGTKLIAINDGKITFRSFLGAGRIYNYSFF